MLLTAHPFSQAGQNAFSFQTIGAFSVPKLAAYTGGTNTLSHPTTILLGSEPTGKPKKFSGVLYGG